MTGQQIVAVLEEQCQPAGASRPFLHLGVSSGLTYTLDRTIVPGVDEEGEPLNICESVEVTNVSLNGEALDMAATYRVTVNNFLVDGGDNFATFADVDPALRVGAGVDLDAFIDYLAEFSPVASPGVDRVHELFT
jgi:5'-nucleotidase